VLLSLAYFPHLLMLKHMMMGHVMTESLNARLLEALTYVVIGALTGALIDRLRLEERRLRQANARLERQSEQLRAAMDDLTRKTREVFESEEQLRRADRLAALGQLTAGLAHEIRNPLASIRGAAEILGDAAIGPDQREEFSRILTEETRRLDQVLSTFLDYARAQKAQAPQQCDLRRVVDQVAALLGRQLDDAGLSLDVAIPADLPPLALGAGLLQQVLVNLLLNALQATPRGGRITLSAEADRREKQALVRVGDSGPGIPREAAEHIFDPFFTTKPHGLGLGLSIVHKIVSNYRGEIRLDPAWTDGAGFIIRLPLA
jgi:signal transduction histidine kinase